MGSVQVRDKILVLSHSFSITLFSRFHGLPSCAMAVSLRRPAQDREQ